jgi:aryl-alcohol dehydrogenase-like predicted oxidoreductase
MSAQTTFAADDHRHFHRHGEAFDVGETFSGVPYEVALAAVEKIRALVPQSVPMAQFALRWILMESGISTVIPGARNVAQAQSNSAASALPPIKDEVMQALRELYLHDIAPYVHQRW